MNVAFSCARGRPAAESDEEERRSDDSVEVTTLRETRTAVPGIIYISKRRGSDRPRIKWYPRHTRRGEPFLSITFEQPPRILNHGVSPRDAVGVTFAAEWAELNRGALLTLWHADEMLDVDELADVVSRLVKLP